jgi:hypothetical protein
MSCGTCRDTGFTYVDDGNGCVAKEPCDHCEAFNDQLQRQTHA